MDTLNQSLAAAALIVGFLIPLLPVLAAVIPRLVGHRGLASGTAARVGLTGVVLGTAVTGLFLFLRAKGSVTTSWSFAGLGIQLDALSVAMTLLVTFVAAVVAAFARSYLHRDGVQQTFTTWFLITTSFVLWLVLSPSLLQLFLAWIGTSVSFHQLLLLYPDRVSAVLAARKKFVISRLGDGLLGGALLLIWNHFGSVDFTVLQAQLGTVAGVQAAVESRACLSACWLVAAAALLKSAQFPFHSWLPDTMETPTPVSALMHAGIINAGGFLVLRLQPLLTVSEGAMALLAVVGGFTALFGSVVMLTQSSVKRALAFSTVAQMGFLFLECGLGIFGAAFLHLTAHSLYKAHAFLRSGEAVARQRMSPSIFPVRPAHLLQAVCGFVAALMVGASISMQWHPAWERAYGEWLLLGLVSASAAFAFSFGVRAASTWASLARTIAGCVIATAASVLLHHGTEAWIRPALRVWGSEPGPVTAAVCAVIGAGFLGVLVLQILVSRPAPGDFLKSLYVHVRNGFYLNTLANRAASLWKRLPQRSCTLGSPTL